MKLIEFAIKNKKKNYKTVNYNEILQTSNSYEIDEILSLSIERPDVFQQLENTSDYSYFFQNNEYKIYNKETKEVLLSLSSIYLFSSITYSRPIIFTNNHEFYYKNLDGNLIFKSFGEDTALYEGCKFKELGAFILFCIVKGGSMDIAVLNLEKDKLIDNLEW